MNMLALVLEKLNSKDYKVKDVAAAVGTSQVTLWAIRKGRGCPCYHTIQKLYDFFYPKAADDKSDNA